jgi:hypothetical protein
MLDEYFDGVLTGEDLAAFERALAASPELRAALEAQRSIDASLARLFHRSGPVALPGQADPPTVAPPMLRLTGEGGPGAAPAATGAAATVGRLSRPISGWWAAAAVMVFGVLAGLYVTGVINVDRWRAGPSLIAADAVYKRKVENDFRPDWVCANDEQFIANTKSMFDEPLLVQSTDGVEVVGWSYYEPVLSSKTAILLAKVDGKEVIVVMDRKENDRKLRLPASSGLHDYKQVIGNVVMHEVSPFDRPRVIPLVQRK